MSVPQRNALFLTVGFLVFFVGMTTCQAETTQKQETLSLNAAVTIAFQNSRQLQIARKELEVAQDKVKQARSGYYPKVNLYGGITRYNNQPTDVELGNQLIALNNGLDAFASGMTHVTSGYQQAYWNGLSENLSQKEYLDDTLTYYGLKLEIDQPIYTGNRLTAINKQADANVAYAQANLVAVQDNVAFEVRKAYYTVITAQRMVVTIQHAVDDMEQHVKEANDYYKAGFVPKLDVIRAEVKLADLKQKLIMAVNGVNLAKKALNFTLGIDLAKEYTIEDSIEFVPFDQSLEDCQKYALEHRPELTALNYKITMAKENVEITKSGNRPMVGLQVKGQDVHPYSPEPTVSLNLVASISIFDGGMVRNKIAEAEDTVNQAETGKEYLTEGIKLEVEQAYRNLTVAKESVQVARMTIDQAKEATRMADVSYKAGLCTSLEKIDAEVALTQAESNYTQALSLYNIAFAQLQKAMGIEEEEAK